MLARLKLRLEDMMLPDSTPMEAARDTYDGGMGIDGIIQGIGFEIHSAEYDDYDLLVDMTVDLRDFVRQGVQYDEDLYDILGSIKPHVTAEQMAELVEWVKAEPLTRAVISSNPSGLDTWQQPAPGL